MDTHKQRCWKAQTCLYKYRQAHICLHKLTYNGMSKNVYAHECTGPTHNHTHTQKMPQRENVCWICCAALRDPWKTFEKRHQKRSTPSPPERLCQCRVSPSFHASPSGLSYQSTWPDYPPASSQPKSRIKRYLLPSSISLCSLTLAWCFSSSLFFSCSIHVQTSLICTPTSRSLSMFSRVFRPEFNWLF